MMKTIGKKVVSLEIEKVIVMTLKMMMKSTHLLRGPRQQKPRRSPPTGGAAPQGRSLSWELPHPLARNLIARYIILRPKISKYTVFLFHSIVLEWITASCMLFKNHLDFTKDKPTPSPSNETADLFYNRPKLTRPVLLRYLELLNKQKWLHIYKSAVPNIGTHITE